MVPCHFVWHNLRQGRNNCQKSPSCTKLIDKERKWLYMKLWKYRYLWSWYIVDGAYNSVRYTITDLTRYPGSHLCLTVTLSLCSNCLLYLRCLRSEYWILQSCSVSSPAALQHCILHREISYTQPQKYEHNLLLSSGVSVCGSGRQWIWEDRGFETVEEGSVLSVDWIDRCFVKFVW